MQLIKATSCLERWNAMIQTEELSYLSSHQTLIADKNWQSYCWAERVKPKEGHL
jgi:hypothetical protein